MGTQQESTSTLPEFLLNPYWLRFAEDDEDENDEGEEEEEEEETDEDEDDEDEDDDDAAEKAKKKKSSGEDTAGLKSALRKERLERRKADKEVKALRKFKEKEESKGKSTAEKATDEATKATQKATALAAKLKTNEVNLAIIKAVRADPKLNFRDIDDALSLVKRSDIEVDQDEDDPSDVDIDEASVVKALKALAKRKPHLLASSEKDEDEEDEDEDDDELERRRSTRKTTGSKVGSRGTRDKGKFKDEDLYNTYPALQAGRPPSRK